MKKEIALSRVKIIVLIYLCLVAALLCVVCLSACDGLFGGESKNGTYYLYENNDYKTDKYIIIDGNVWKDDDGVKGKFKVNGTDFTMYIELYGFEEVLTTGKIDNGVMEVNDVSGKTYYCKKGKVPDNLGAETENGITYKRINKGNLSGFEIVDVDSSKLSDTFIIPSKYKNKSVISIGNDAFSGCDSLISITIPKDVRSIERNAFSGCSSLTSINVDVKNQYYSSQDGILYNKNKTEFIYVPIAIKDDITIPNSITSIGRAFNGRSNLTSIEIPNSVTSIGGGAFENCSGLTSITIPKSVTDIELTAFSGCSSLTSITIPKNVTSIEYDVFDSCSSLTSISVDSENHVFNSQGGILYNKDISKLIYAPRANDGNVTIPNSVTNIGHHAFEGCSNLTSIEIPNSVTSIGNSAFEGCSSLTSIEIPNSVTGIGDSAFQDCSSLTSVNV